MKLVMLLPWILNGWLYVLFQGLHLYNTFLYIPEENQNIWLMLLLKVETVVLKWIINKVQHTEHGGLQDTVLYVIFQSLAIVTVRWKVLYSHTDSGLAEKNQSTLPWPPPVHSRYAHQIW